MKKLIMAVVDNGAIIEGEQLRLSPDLALPLQGDKAITKEDAMEVLTDFIDILYEDLEREGSDGDNE